MDDREEEFPIPKSKWGPGPWQDEPDRLEFEHHGFPCLIHRNMINGNFCGYVAMPPGHPWHGWSEEAPVEVHGGLTYAGACSGHICHVPKPGQPDNVWWLGFDCAHSEDLSPGMDALMENTLPAHLRPSSSARHYFRPTYKTIDYVRAECEALAEQAKAAAALPLDPDAAAGQK